jgi:SMI1 / KNR4 family (SUKH-1)
MPFDLAESFLVLAEQALGARLPEAYRGSMLRENGGELEVEGEEWQQYPVADTSDRKRLSRTANHVIKETENCQGWPSFPEGALAIAGNGYGDQLVFLRQGGSFAPAVFVWWHETGELDKIAEDFAELKTLS